MYIPYNEKLHFATHREIEDKNFNWKGYPTQFDIDIKQKQHTGPHT